MASSKRKLKLGSCTTFLKITPVSYDGTALLGLAVCDLAMEKISHLHYQLSTPWRKVGKYDIKARVGPRICMH